VDSVRRKESNRKRRPTGKIGSRVVLGVFLEPKSSKKDEKIWENTCKQTTPRIVLSHKEGYGGQWEGENTRIANTAWEVAFQASKFEGGLFGGRL